MPIFYDFYGGISDSVLAGIRGSFANLVGLDIFSDPNILKVEQKMTKNSGTTVTDLCKNVVVVSDGNTYWFSSDSGKIWKKTSADVWSLVHTNTKGACLGAMEFGGYIYYVGAGFIGRQQKELAASEASWSSQDDDWQTLSNADATYAPMCEVNNILFIGNGKYIAKWDGSTYTDNALDFPSQHRVSALYTYDVTLLIGTYVGTSATIKVNYCKVFRWDTVSDTWNSSDTLYEAGINAFIPADNEVYIQAGMNGNIYYYNGQILIPFKKIPGTYTPTRYNIVYNQSVNYYKGLSLIGVSDSSDTANSTGNPCNCGIYALGRLNKNYPIVLSLPYPVSATSPLADVEIGTIAVIGNDLYASWKKQGGSPTYGIDKLDFSNKYASAYLETLAINQGLLNKKLVEMIVGYKSKPTGTAIGISHKKNYASSYTETTEQTETKNQTVFSKENLHEIRAFQMKLDFTVSANDAMELDMLSFLFDGE